ncbi:MAG: hypothetical protein MZW92_36400 [Comamonadaceae bacterium]|nr:hypothetical protein [Comamonadaceae bacterium]
MPAGSAVAGGDAVARRHRHHVQRVRARQQHDEDGADDEAREVGDAEVHARLSRRTCVQSD